MHATVISTRPGRQTRQHPLLLLAEDDLDFVVQFVLASGSLKEMAQLHGVSYPTIRATLDRVISNLRQSLSGTPPDAMTELLATLLERGEIEPATAKRIRGAYRSMMERMNTTNE